MGRTSSQLTGVLLIVGFLAALHTVGLRASMLGPAFAAVVLAALATSPVRIARAPIDLLLLAFTCWIVAVTLPHLGIWESSFQLTVFLLLPLAFVALRGMQDPEFDQLLTVFVLVLTSLGVVAVLYAIGGDRQSPIFPNRNNQAALLNMGALLAAGLAMGRHPTRSGWRWMTVATVILVAGATLAGSRGAMLGLGAGVVVFAIVARDRFKQWCLLVATPVAAGWCIAAFIGAGWVAQRAATLADPQLAGSMRFGQWSTALELVTAAPMFGHGLGLTHWAWAATRLPDRSFGVYPHNDYIQYAVEAGLPGAVLLVTVVAAVLWTAARHGPGSRRAGEVAGAATAVTAVAVHALVSYHLQLAPFLLLLGLMAAVVARGTPDRGALIGDSVWGRRAVLVVLMCHAGLLTAYGLAMPQYRIPYWLFSQSRLEYAQPPSDAVMRRLRLAATLQPHATEARLALASALWAACHEDRVDDYCDRARQHADTAVRRNRHSYEAMYLRGKYAGDIGDLLRAIAMNPRFTAPRVAAAQLHLAAGQSHAALAVLKDGLGHLARPTTQDIGYLDLTAAVAGAQADPDTVATVEIIRRRIGYRMRD